ncbi:MAG: UDP-N-acetylmuramate dehydrogenase [Sandaracinaceae bacterium]|nr:UDP-N-acetylmuramate dehydrogenase [Sandaracinaceae bacterium]
MLVIESDRPLAPLTTLELGGPARFFAEVRSTEELLEAIEWAESQSLPLCVLGGGSNVVVADHGFPGLMVRMGIRGIESEENKEGRIELRVGAGEPWDGLVQWAVERDLQGIECLSGIPGSVGAAPVQNIGAYGQELAETIEWVEAFDRKLRRFTRLGRKECAFAYRNSRFKREEGRFIITRLCLALRPRALPRIDHAELAQALSFFPSLTLSAVRETVLALRRKKSMVLDPANPNRRSVGSFFLNPILPLPDAMRLMSQAIERGVVSSFSEIPHWPAGEGQVKLSAAWLIEQSGFSKGFRRGAVGISSAHALALVHHGGGTSSELLNLAADIQRAVKNRFGVELEFEARFIG